MLSAVSYSGRVRIRACALILKNDSILLVNQNVPTQNEPIWLPPGGGVELGETITGTLLREIHEETNLRISEIRLRYIHEFIQLPFHAVEFYYIAEQFEGRLKIGYDPEMAGGSQQILDVRFVPIKYISNLNVHPRFLIDEINSGKLKSDEISQFKTNREN